jgi:ABC-type multidrug transport system ATPase subunit
MGSSITGVAMNALEISGLKKTYQGASKPKGIDLTVKQGDFFALLPQRAGNPPPSA